MGELILIRHGQADFSGDDYDRLTDLGRQQASWLGAYLAEMHDGPHVRVFSGHLRRQQETAKVLAAVLGCAVESADGLEEYDADGLLAASGHAPDRSLDRAAHFRRLRGVLLDWADDRIAPVPESFAAFRSRVDSALDALRGLTAEGPVLAVTSGGVIAAALATVLGLAPGRLFDLNLQMRNSGVTRLIVGRSSIFLNQFNTVPHLDRPDRAAFVTYS